MSNPNLFANQVVLVEEPVVYRGSPDYAGLLFNRTYPTKPGQAILAYQALRPPWTFFESPFVSVYGVQEQFSLNAIQPPVGNFFAFIKPARRVLAEEPEEQYQRFNHSVFWQYVRLYAAQLVGYTFQLPDFCDDPWLEWVHPKKSDESAIYPYRQINVFIRGQQFNLFFNQPRPWPVEGEIDTVSRLANYGIMSPWFRPAIPIIMPNVIGLDQYTAAQVIEAVANLPPPIITWQDYLGQIPPTPLIGMLPAPPPLIPYGIVINQYPGAGTILGPPFTTIIVLSTGRVRLPGIGDSTNFSPVNVVIGSITGP